MERKLKVRERLWSFTRLQIIVCSAVISACLVFTLPSTSKANVHEQGGGWQFAAEVYLWGASIGGETATGSDLDIDFDDIIDGLNMALMGTVGVKKDRLGFMMDTIYLDTSDNNNLNTRIGGVNANVDLSSWIITPMVGYEVVQADQFSLNVIAGLRYLYLNADVDLRNADPAGPAYGVSASDSGDNWDGIIGVRGDIIFATDWFIPYHLDIGTGDSDFTWQAFAGLGYHFKHFDILAGYRYLSWDFDDNDVIDDMNLSGFIGGMKFYF